MLAPRNARRWPRRGFTIVEVLVALVLVAIGLLAIAGAETLAWRRRAVADREVRAGLLVRNRIESIAAASCEQAVAGQMTHPDDIRERWGIARRGSILLVEARADWPTPSGDDSVALAGSRWCP